MHYFEYFLEIYWWKGFCRWVLGKFSLTNQIRNLRRKARHFEHQITIRQETLMWRKSCILITQARRVLWQTINVNIKNIKTRLCNLRKNFVKNTIRGLIFKFRTILEIFTINDVKLYFVIYHCRPHSEMKDHLCVDTLNNNRNRFWTFQNAEFERMNSKLLTLIKFIHFYIVTHLFI